jgi:hypothetical protein
VLTYKHKLILSLTGGGGGYSQHVTGGGGGGGTLNTTGGGGGGGGVSQQNCKTRETSSPRPSGQPCPKLQNERLRLLAQALGLVLRCLHLCGRQVAPTFLLWCLAPMRTPYGSDFPSLPLCGPQGLAPMGSWPVWLHRSVQPPLQQLVS